MVSTWLRPLLCAVLGGHQPMVKLHDGRVRMVCAFNCGWQSIGVETLGQQRIRERQEQCLTVIREWQATREPKRRRIA